jgi:hypothetical protein
MVDKDYFKLKGKGRRGVLQITVLRIKYRDSAFANIWCAVENV